MISQSFVLIPGIALDSLSLACTDDLVSVQFGGYAGKNFRAVDVEFFSDLIDEADRHIGTGFFVFFVSFQIDFQFSGVSNIVIERTGTTKVKINIFTAKPGIVIGRNGAEIEVLRKELEKMTNKQVDVRITEVKRPDVDAQLVAEATAGALERRTAFRRAMKQAIGRAKKSGAEGIKIAISGRLAGADIARTEWASEGKVPLHTLRADIDYGFAEADTTYGKIGVKVWIYKGEVLPEAKKQG